MEVCGLLELWGVFIALKVVLGIGVATVLPRGVEELLGGQTADVLDGVDALRSETTDFEEELLGVSADLCDRPDFDLFLNRAPLFSVLLETYSIVLCLPSTNSLCSFLVHLPITGPLFGSLLLRPPFGSFASSLPPCKMRTTLDSSLIMQRSIWSSILS